MAGFGTGGGVRLVVGVWAASPYGSFADVMVQTADDERVLLAPDEEIADFVGSTYQFDRVVLGPVDADLAPEVQVDGLAGAEIGGDDAIRTFARRRIDSILSGVTATDDITETADQVATALTQAGYATTTTPVTGPIGGVQICQHHCPVSHVAEEFPELCDAEREAFAEVLGTHVQRLATIVNGDCACTTHVPVIPEHAVHSIHTATQEEGVSQ